MPDEQQRQPKAMALPPCGCQKFGPDGRNRIARLMCQEPIQGKRKRTFRVTTDSDPGFPTTGNILDRKFTIGMPNKAWVADITSELLTCPQKLSYNRAIFGHGCGPKPVRFFSLATFHSSKIEPNRRSAPKKAVRNQRDHVRSSERTLRRKRAGFIWPACRN